MTIPNLYALYLRHPHICNDTRKITPGCIYWAIRGERFDGNAFAAEALGEGAALAVIDRPEYGQDERYIVVDDSLKALQELAAYHRQQLGIPVIAITGSNGKTTTKELMQRVLAEKLHTFATPGNLNNHIGLPLSLLQLTAAHQAAVIELGANHQGENAFLCEICRPDFGLITNIGKDHLEGFGGMEGVEKANMELFDYLRRHGGKAFVNMDDPRIVRNTQGLECITYGTGPETLYRGRVAERFPFLTADIHHPEGEKMTINTHLFGAFNMYNLLAAAAVGFTFGIPQAQIKQALESYRPENNRSQLVQKGSNTIILDAYNANPSSMQGGISDFQEYPQPHKVLLLGDMFELGEDSYAEHKAMLELIQYDAFDAVGLAGEAFFQCKDQFPAHFFENTAALTDWLRTLSFQDTYFYIKGSRGMRMEQCVEAIQAINSQQ